MKKNLTLGIFGFGVVGQGLHDIIRTKDLNLCIKKIGIKHPDKKRSLPAEMFTTDADELLEDPAINTILELINDTEAAYYIVKKALLMGKDVVSASKKMLALHLPELLKIQAETGASLLYEGAVCGSIPIIRNLEEYYDNELLLSVRGIFNGSSNYILTKVCNENISYGEALRQAQELGFAEADPIMDVGGFDSKFKLAIVALHAYGMVLSPDDIFNIGIQNLSEHDIRYAAEKNYRIRLVPEVREIDEKRLLVYVMPRFVLKDDFLYNVDNEYNGVIVQAAFADRQFFFGKGAGGHPTGAAVFSDIAALRYGYRYEYRKHFGVNGFRQDNEQLINVYFRYTGEDLLKCLDFTEITEHYRSGSYSYVCGSILLSSLIRQKDRLASEDVFLAEREALC